MKSKAVGYTPTLVDLNEKLLRLILNKFQPALVDQLVQDVNSYEANQEKIRYLTLRNRELYRELQDSRRKKRNEFIEDDQSEIKRLKEENEKWEDEIQRHIGQQTDWICKDGAKIEKLEDENKTLRELQGELVSQYEKMKHQLRKLVHAIRMRKERTIYEDECVATGEKILAKIEGRDDDL